MFHILRDARTLYIIFGMPVVLLLIFGYAVTNEFKDASLGIYDGAKDDMSQTLIEHLTASGHLKLKTYAENINEIDAAFKRGDIKIGIIIPPGFEEQFYSEKATTIQIVTDGTEPNYATTLTNYASRMIMEFRQRKIEMDEIPFQINLETRMFYNPKLLGAYNFVPGVVALILMLICAMMTSLTIAREKELGTMDLLLVSPLPPIIIILGKVTPYAVLSFFSALMVLAMGYYVFDVPILGSLSLLLFLVLLYLLVALVLGVFISTKAPNQQLAMMISLFALLLPTMLLSGFIFPIDSMPAILQYISVIVPAKYFITIEKAVMLKGAGLESVITQAGVLVLMVFVLLVFAWKNFKVIYK